jgi:hypothetical protein
MPTARRRYFSADHSGVVIISTTPPAGHLLGPTLYTRRNPVFPHPPTAEAAVGGEGNRRTHAGEVGETGGLRNRLSLLCRERIRSRLPRVLSSICRSATPLINLLCTCGCSSKTRSRRVLGHRANWDPMLLCPLAAAIASA